jgi:2-C-methyl-D-erythritol 4-phosphate cytidylyltransferase
MPVSDNCHAVLPAAGIGTRMGGELPKQYLELAGATIFEHSLRALLASPRLDTVVVALHPQDQRARHMALMQDPRIVAVAGGAERCDSVLAALRALAQRVPGDDWVLVHDAARPGLTAADIERLVTACRQAGHGGILAQPVVDTVKQADAAGRVAQTVERSRLWRAQTPQMFRLQTLLDALTAALARGQAVTDEASAMELAGEPVLLVPGSPANLKITVPADLELAAWYLQRAVAEDTPCA